MLFKEYKIPYNEEAIKTVFTHNSFSEEKNNSRLVFLGQFQFRGLVSKWIFKNIAGTGTQLQHFLGNVFSQKYLVKLFDDWQISKVRLANSNDLECQKHIFIYAILGYIANVANERQIFKFIFDFFILPFDKILPQNYKNPNQWNQLQFLCRQHFDAKPHIKAEVKENLQNITVFFIDEILAQHTSISYKYARKKVIKESLKKIVARIEETALQNPIYLQNEKNRQEQKQNQILEEKREKQEKHLARNLLHSKKMEEKRILKKAEALESDKKRKSTKQKLKESTSKKGKDSIYRTYTTEEIAEMSNSKRRNLQDRGIIPKNVVK